MLEVDPQAWEVLTLRIGASQASVKLQPSNIGRYCYEASGRGWTVAGSSMSPEEAMREAVSEVMTRGRAA